MPKSNAERQRAYRANRPFAGENGERRLSTWLTTAASLALVRLANHYGVTQRQILERLLLAADKAVSDTMSDEQVDLYYRGGFD
jgi:hypothetical protein